MPYLLAGILPNFMPMALVFDFLSGWNGPAKKMLQILHDTLCQGLSIDYVTKAESIGTGIDSVPQRIFAGDAEYPYVPFLVHEGRYL